MQELIAPKRYRRVRLFANDFNAEVTNVAHFIAEYRPTLQLDDYEEYGENEGYSTIAMDVEK